MDGGDDLTEQSGDDHSGAGAEGQRADEHGDGAAGAGGVQPVADQADLQGQERCKRSLQDPADQEHLEGRRPGDEHRPHGEAEDRDAQQPAVSVHVPEPAEQRHGHGGGEELRRVDPVEVARTDVKYGTELGQQGRHHPLDDAAGQLDEDQESDDRGHAGGAEAGRAGARGGLGTRHGFSSWARPREGAAGGEGDEGCGEGCVFRQAGFRLWAAGRRREVNWPRPVLRPDRPIPA